MLVENAQVRNIIQKWGAVAPTVSQMFSSVSPAGNPFGNMSSVVNPVGAVSKLAVSKLAVRASSPSFASLLSSAFGSLKEKLPQPPPTAVTAASIPATSPSVSEMQSVIVGTLIPEINTIVARLRKIEGQGYRFTVTKEMQGNPYGKDITLNDGEFYTLDAALNVVLALLDIATAYNFDVYDYNANGTRNDYSAISQDPLKTLNDPNFFTLKSNGGTTRMADALASLKSAAEKAKSAYDVVKLRGAGYGAFDITGWSSTQKSDFEETLALITTALNGETTIPVNGQQVTMDVTKFFTNPLTRSDLPALGYDVPRDAALSATYGKPVAAEKLEYVEYWTGDDWAVKMVPRPVTCEIVPKSNFPDYTLNGIFPGNSPQNNIAGFTGLLPAVDGKVLKDSSGKVVGDYYWGSYASDGTSIYSLSYLYDANSNMALKKIDPSTGIVSDFAKLASDYWINNLILTGNDYYSFEFDWQNSALGLYPWNRTSDGSPWSLAGTPAWSTTAGEAWITSAAASGSSVYYVLSRWDEATGRIFTDLWKLDNFSNPIKLFPVQDYYVNALAYANNSIFMSGGGGTRKLDMTGKTVATYPQGFSVLTGGYLYQIHDSKLIKYSLP